MTAENNQDKNSGTLLSEHEMTLDAIHGLVKFLGGEKMGSVKLTAFFNYWNYEKLLHDRSLLLENKIKHPFSEDRLEMDSEIRTADTKVAIIDSEIEQNRTTLPGYDKAYMKTATLLNRINLGFEVEENRRSKKYQSDEEVRDGRKTCYLRYKMEIEEIYRQKISNENV
jgi:hypothetical protein